MTAYLDLTSRFNAMRCDFLDQEEQTHIDKIKQFVSDVKEKITSKDVDQHTVEDTMQKALAFLTQPVPNLTDSEDCEDQELSMLKRLKKKDSEDFQATGDEELSMLKRLKEKDELEQMKQAFVSLQNHCDSLKKDTERLETKVKELESEHKMSSYVLDKRMSKIRDFIKRNPRTEDSPQGGSRHGTEHSIQGDSSQGKATIFSSGTNDISDYVTNGTRELTALTVCKVLNSEAVFSNMIYLPSELLVFVIYNKHTYICIYNCKTFAKVTHELENVRSYSRLATKPDSQDEIFLASDLELKVLSVTMDSCQVKRTYVIGKQFCALASLLNGLLVGMCDSQSSYCKDLQLLSFDPNGDMTTQNIVSGPLGNIFCPISASEVVICNTDTVQGFDVNQKTTSFFKRVSRSAAKTITLSCVALCPSGHLIMCDQQTNTLFLTDSRGQYIRDLWTYPDPRCRIENVCMSKNYCFCLVQYGSSGDYCQIYVLYFVF